MPSYLRTGQAASALGISPHYVRKLCEAGRIEAEQTAGGQYRIPIAEIERIQDSGELPLIPHGPGANAHHPPTPRSETSYDELPDQSDDVKTSGEEVVITRNKLETRKIERDLVEVENFFDQRQRQEQRRAARQRQAWLDRWLQYACELLPRGAPNEIKLELGQAVPDALKRRRPDEPASLTRQIVGAAVSKALRPHQQAQETERAISEALQALPAGAKGFSFSPSSWELKARLETAQVLGALPAAASYERKLAAARDEAGKIAQQFERQQARRDHESTCEEIARKVDLHDVAGEDGEQARETVRQELTKFPVGTRREQLEKAREQVLEPFRLKQLRRTLPNVGPFDLGLNSTAEDHEQAVRAIEEAFKELPADADCATLKRVQREVLDECKEEVEQRRICEEIARDPWALVDIDSEHREQAREAVRRELLKFPGGTSREQLKKASDRVLEPFRLRRLRRTLAEFGPFESFRWNLVGEDRKNAQRAIAEAFAELPEDTGQEELERVRKKVLDDREEKNKKRSEIQSKVQSSLGHIDRYLREEYEFESPSKRLQEEQELRQIIEPKLSDELQAREMDDEDSRVFIEELVDEEPGEEQDLQQ